MGKKGPCYHCGVANTPLWRNGPPDKPILCNACGSRWRTKGSLMNYIPLHSRGDPDEYEDQRRMKSISLQKKDEKLNKRKLNFENMKVVDREYTPDYNHEYLKIIDEDTSNRSSSGSAISNESCGQFSSADVSELTGPALSVVRDGLIPSWKRPCLTRPKQSPVEKLTKDLYTIFHKQASQFSSSSEEDLLYESELPMVSVEIGHGSMLIRHPSSMAREEESEASSLSVNKRSRVDVSYSNSASLMSLNDGYSVNNSFFRVEDVGKLNGQMMNMEHLNRDKNNHEKFQVLCNHKSPLSCIDLMEIVNFDVLQGYLTEKEQEGLLKYLPSVDKFSGSDSLEKTFTGSHFKENISSFQRLLAEGVLDNSFSGIKTADCRALKRLALFNSSKCKWVEHHNMLKNKDAEERTEGRISKSRAESCFSGSLVSGSPEAKRTMKSPKRALPKVDYKRKGQLQNDPSYSTPTSKKVFASPTNSSSLMLHYTPYEDEIDDQDLLLDVPSNSSFPQAELLCPTPSFGYRHSSAGSTSIHPSNHRI